MASILLLLQDASVVHGRFRFPGVVDLFSELVEDHGILLCLRDGFVDQSEDAVEDFEFVAVNDRASLRLRRQSVQLPVQLVRVLDSYLDLVGLPVIRVLELVRNGRGGVRNVR